MDAAKNLAGRLRKQEKLRRVDDRNMACDEDKRQVKEHAERRNPELKSKGSGR